MFNFVRQMCLAWVSVCLVCGPAFGAGEAAPLLDPNLPIYRPLERLEGELKLGRLEHAFACRGGLDRRIRVVLPQCENLRGSQRLARCGG